MKVILIVVFILLSIAGFTQAENTDSLKKAINSYKSRDTVYSKMLFDYSYKLQISNVDSALPYLMEAINVATDLRWSTGLIKEKLLLSYIQLQSNKLDSAIATAFRALKLSEEINDPYLIINSNAQLADDYRLLGDEKMQKYLEKNILASPDLLETIRLFYERWY